jgi:regulator of CtrA degradation
MTGPKRSIAGKPGSGFKSPRGTAAAKFASARRQRLVKLAQRTLRGARRAAVRGPAFQARLLQPQPDGRSVPGSGTSQRDSASNIVETGALIMRTYDEALALTREVRDYIATEAPADKAALDHDTQLVASCEEMRVTARMTQVMAWLMLQRAVNDGEIDREQAAQPDNRLGGQETCLAEPAVDPAYLPDRLADLMVRSHSLYERIQRLDLMLEPAGRA